MPIIRVVLEYRAFVQALLQPVLLALYLIVTLLGRSFHLKIDLFVIKFLVKILYTTGVVAIDG